MKYTVLPRRPLAVLTALTLLTTLLATATVTAARPTSAAAAALPPGGIVDSVAGFGRTAGSFSVGDDGAARYTVPLWLPDGRGAAEPRLSLSYNSRAGNGLMGVGWSLDGLSSISWCPRTIAQDGYTDGGHVDGADALCLNGTRLIPVSPPQLPQRYYQTEVETFDRITAFGAEDNVPDYFEVRRRDGLILTYGQTADSRVTPFLLQAGSNREEPAVGRAPGNPRVTTSWALNQIADRNGNSTTVAYYDTESGAEGLWWSQLRPRRISYAPNRQVEFEYTDSRPDPIDGYSSGTHTRIDRLLARVAISAGPQGGESKLVRQYRLAYDDGLSITRRSLLTSLTDCDGAGVCRRPQTFDWSSGSYSFDRSDEGPSQSEPVTVVDVDGDGRSDVLTGSRELRRSSGTGFFGPVDSGLPSGPGLVSADVDGGGTSEVLADAPDSEQGPGRRWRLYRSNGTSFEKAPGDLGRWRSSQEQSLASYLIDLDGNGLPDFVETRSSWASDPNAWYYRLNNGGQPANQFGPRVASTIARNANYFNFAADTDGDGRAELVDPRRNDAGAGWGLNAAGGPENLSPNLWQGSAGRAHFGDVNGDGLEDFVLPHRPDEETPGKLQVQLNSGNGFGSRLHDTSPAGYVPPRFSGARPDLGVRLVDFNGDGRDDVVIFFPGKPFPGRADSGLQVYLWSDGRFVHAPVELEIGEDNGTAEGWNNTDVLDVDGDGTLDIVNAGTGGRLTLFKRLGGMPDLLTGIGDVSVRDRTEIDYSPLADRDVHIPATDCTYPQICVGSGGAVVAQHRTWNFSTSGPAPAWDRYNHVYSGARSDAHGRGWLGFGSHTVVRLFTGATTRTDFDNTTRDPGIKAYPFAGLPDRVTTTVKDSPTGREHRSVTDTEYRVRRHAGGGYSVEPRQIVVTDSERPSGNGSWTTLRENTTVNVFDDFGNVELRTSITTGGRTVVEDPTYRNDTSRWLLGLVTRKTVRACTRLSVCTTRTTSADYDDKGQPISAVTEPDKPDLRMTTATAYNQFGSPVTVTRSDALGNQRQDRFEYADADKVHPTATINAVGHRTTIETHSALGVPLRVTDPNQVATTMTYDGFGRPRGSQHADGSGETIAHAVAGTWDRTMTSANGGGSATTFTDELGREAERWTTAFDGSNSITLVKFDALGRPRMVSRPRGPSEEFRFTVTDYDNLGRPVQVTDPDGVRTRSEYVGRETHAYDGRNIHSYTVTTVDDELESSYEDDPKSTGWLRTRYEHGPFGEVTKVVAADETQQVMTYDGLGRRKRLDDPSTGATVTTYNAFGEPATETDGTGATTTLVRDALGRVKTSTSPDGTATNVWDTAANGKGQLTKATSTDGVTTVNTYDEHGKQDSGVWTVDGTGYRLDFGYDGFGRRSEITYPAIPGNNGRLTVAYGYNSSGYLNQARNADGSQVYWTAEARNSAGQLVSERLGTGGTSVVGSRRYNTVGLLTGVTVDGAVAGRMSDVGYTYDENRNVVDRRDNLRARQDGYGYDSLDRLRTWTLTAAGQDTVTTFDHDRVGNVRSETVDARPERNVTYTYGENGAPPHALTTRNGQHYDFDAAGRQTAGAGRTVDYNQSGLPASLTWGQGRRTDFAYDATGARVLKRDGTNSLITIAGLFERRSPEAGGSQTHNLHNIVVDGRVVAQINRVQETPTGAATGPAPRYLHSDLQGSTVLVTNAAGRPADTDESWLREIFYDPFGRRVQADGTPLGNQRRGGPHQGYTGHEHDDEFGLINMLGRIYDPEQRRFLTPDVVVADPMSSQSYNRYAYVANNPATATDPTGFMPKAYGHWSMPFVPNPVHNLGAEICGMRCQITPFKRASANSADDDQSNASPAIAEYAVVIAGAGDDEGEQLDDAFDDLGALVDLVDMVDLPGAAGGFVSILDTALDAFGGDPSDLPDMSGTTVGQVWNVIRYTGGLAEATMAVWTVLEVGVNGLGIAAAVDAAVAALPGVALVATISEGLGVIAASAYAGFRLRQDFDEFWGGPIGQQIMADFQELGASIADAAPAAAETLVKFDPMRGLLESNPFPGLKPTPRALTPDEMWDVEQKFDAIRRAVPYESPFATDPFLDSRYVPYDDYRLR